MNGVYNVKIQYMPGKRIQLDEGTWQALDLLSRNSMKTFQELADEAFNDLLKKHGRPTDLKTALKRSIQSAPSAPSRRPRSKAGGKMSGS